MPYFMKDFLKNRERHHHEQLLDKRTPGRPLSLTPAPNPKFKSHSREQNRLRKQKQRLRDKCKEIVKKTPVPVKEVIVTKKGETLVHEKYTPPAPEKPPGKERVVLRAVPANPILPCFVCHHCGARMRVNVNISMQKYR